ncbi:hypothetical protein, partial [Caballeronia sp. BR00000012568055]|uniref:hypothetical protein n=1 Tax=Caballeronia sp. BR00000012568055 TaxID=2918761 RepID=UPI0023F69670
AQAESIQSTAQQSFHTKRNLERMAAVAQQDVQNLQEIVEKIKSLERTAASAQTTAGASAATAESQKDLVVEYAVELEESVESKRQLFDEFEKYREQIEGTLQGASKVALAKSFERRRDALIRAQKMWAIAFGIGILVLLGTGCAITHELVTSTPMVPSAVSSGSATVLSGVSAAAETTTALKGQLAGFVGVLLRFVVLSPVIWFTWFSARQ